MKLMWLTFMYLLFLLAKASKYHQTDYTIVFERVEVTDYNRSYFSNISCGLVYYNRTYRAVNVTANLVENMSMNITAALQLYKFLSNEYRFFPLTISVDGCAELKRDSYGIQESLQKSLNFDLHCPITRGFKKMTYGMIDYSKFPPYIPGGRYKAELKAIDKGNFLFEAHLYGKVEEVLKKWQI